MVFMELLVLRGGEGRAQPARSHLRGGEARHGGGYGREGGSFLPPASASLLSHRRESAAAASACDKRSISIIIILPSRCTRGRDPALKQF